MYGQEGFENIAGDDVRVLAVPPLALSPQDFACQRFWDALAQDNSRCKDTARTLWELASADGVPMNIKQSKENNLWFNFRQLWFSRKQALCTNSHGIIIIYVSSIQAVPRRPPPLPSSAHGMVSGQAAPSP